MQLLLSNQKGKKWQTFGEKKLIKVHGLFFLGNTNSILIKKVWVYGILFRRLNTFQKTHFSNKRLLLRVKEQQEAKEEGKGIKRKNDEVENVGKGSKADQVNTKMTEPLSKQKNIKTSSSDLKIKEDSEEREEEETYADPQSQDH